MTDRDLYLGVARLAARHRESTRPLGVYLRALWGVAHHRREQAELTPDEVLGALAASFTAEPEPFGDDFLDAVSADLYALDLYDTPGFQGWEYRIARQVLDLGEMARGGQLGEPHRYLGVKAPRGSLWYNFDPCTFLECAAAGTFGGRTWEDDPDREASQVPAISWEAFRDFLGCGQWYE